MCDFLISLFHALNVDSSHEIFSPIVLVKSVVSRLFYISQILYKESSKVERENKTTSKEDLVNGVDDDSDMVLSDDDDDDNLPDMTDGI